MTIVQVADGGIHPSRRPSVRGGKVYNTYIVFGTIDQIGSNAQSVAFRVPWLEVGVKLYKQFRFGSQRAESNSATTQSCMPPHEPLFREGKAPVDFMHAMYTREEIERQRGKICIFKGKICYTYFSSMKHMLGGGIEEILVADKARVLERFRMPIEDSLEG